MGRQAWLAHQLRPGPPGPMPAPVQAQIDLMTLTRVPLDQIVANLDRLKMDGKREPGGKKPKAMLRNESDASMSMQAAEPGAVRNQPFRDELTRLYQEAAERNLLRSLYSPDQLREQLTWFWYNHFNVLGHGHTLPGLLGDYEDRAIRGNALGRFRDLLGAVVTHPAMLIYLNNDKNTAGHINENFARELMELHTLGVDGGYTQVDVQNLARVLTGLGTSYNRSQGKGKVQGDQEGKRSFVLGISKFSPALHDSGNKQLLGQPVTGQGWAEIEQTLDRLARHPATAQHVSHKLAQYFVADEPPAELVNRMAKKFLATDGDIPAVLTVMFDSPEFTASLDRKFKDPTHYMVSALRLAFPEPRAIPVPSTLVRWVDRMGQKMYGRTTPDGYPLNASDWNASGQMSARFDVARLIANGAAPLFDSKQGERRDARPQLDSAFFREHIEPTLSANTRAVLKDTSNPSDWGTVLLSSPEFMTR